MNFENDFPMKKENVIYFDNAATTFKPIFVMEEVNKYYTKYTSNVHRGDYNISFTVNDLYDLTREKVHKFINSRFKEEIVFTSGSTESLNMVVFGFFENYLKDGDEVLLTKSEHASNVLPWFILSLKKNIKIKYIELNEEHKITKENLLMSITNKTKVISIAHITNVIGDERNIKEITSIAHKHNILVVVDGAQSVPHIKTDVIDTDIDFLAFSAHKMCGPTGVGVLYGKLNLLKNMLPYKYGGGMNEEFDSEKLLLAEIPYRFEGGTPNIEGILGLKASIDYIEKIGIEEIHKHEIYLKNYLIKRLREIEYIKIYNENSEGAIVLINAENVMAGDLGLYLNSRNICTRSGIHCAKLLKSEEELGNTVRISLYFYNTYEEIDILIEALKDKEELYKFVK
ncbi:MAG: cysteine desulfurase [Bacilli bacterium]|nr:cysteine desulfurase [Bacilli bacterium]